MQYITEQQLIDLVDCPLKTTGPIEEETVFATALETASKAVLQSFEGRVHSLAEIREIFGHIWSKSHPTPFKDRHYWDGIKKAPHVAKTIRQLLEKYEVVLPRSLYRVQIRHVILEGKYTILKKRTNKSLAVLNLHSHRPLNYFAPRVIEAARWLGWVIRHSHETTISLNVPLLRGEQWSHDTFTVDSAHIWLLNAQSSQTLPRPGSHCLECKDRLCLTPAKDVPLWTQIK